MDNQIAKSERIARQTKAVEMYNEGMGTRTIAKILGMSRVTVCGYVNPEYRKRRRITKIRLDKTILGRINIKLRSSRMQAKIKGYIPCSSLASDLKDTITKLCNVCKKKHKNWWELHLDHCHKTGKFRGWLCSHCNTGIGYFGDNVEKMKAAIAYLGGRSNA